MKCMIQWVLDGKPTPDDNDAVCLAQPFDPRVVDEEKGGFKVQTPFVFADRIREYHAGEGSVVLADGTTALPICEEHLKRLPAFWRALPFPKQEEKDWHSRVRSQAPPEVLEAIINAFPNNCEEILKSLRHHPGDKFWSFIRWGMFIGVEPDGHIHS